MPDKAVRAKDLREQDAGELAQKERELREELFRLRLRKGAGQVGNPMRRRIARRELAKVMTVLGERRQEGKS